MLQPVYIDLHKFNSLLVAFEMSKFGLRMAFVFGSRHQSKIVMLFFLKYVVIAGIPFVT